MLPNVYNHTGFPYDISLLADSEGQLGLLLVLSSAYEFSREGTVDPAVCQVPVCQSDVHVGVPGNSTLLDEAAAPPKPLVDVVLNGTAFSPGGRPATEVLVGLRVGLFRKILLVTGDRTWSGPLRNRPSIPTPFVTIPLIYERAFGGTLVEGNPPQIQDLFGENPIGIGYKGALPYEAAIATHVPNIELPSSRLVNRGDQIAVAGLSPIARNWLPRVQYAGTYDDKWLRHQWPLPAKDLDLRFHQCAPVDQQLTGDLLGQEVSLQNLTPEGNCRFSLPVPDLSVHLIATTGNERCQLVTDTVIIEPDVRRVRLISRLLLRDLHRRAIRDIVIGQITQAWLRARARGKLYLGNGVAV